MAVAVHYFLKRRAKKKKIQPNNYSNNQLSEKWSWGFNKGAADFESNRFSSILVLYVV